MILYEGIRELLKKLFIFHKLKEKFSKKWVELLGKFFNKYGKKCYPLVYSKHALQRFQEYSIYLYGLELNAPICFMGKIEGHYNTIKNKIIIGVNNVEEIGFDKKTKEFAHLLVSFDYNNKRILYALKPIDNKFFVKTIILEKEEDKYKREFMPTLFLYNTLTKYDLHQFKF